MEEKKVQINSWVSPGVKEEIRLCAIKERRPPSMVGALLLEWAAQQLARANGLLDLLGMSVAPRDAETRLRESERAAARQAGEQAETRKKKSA